MALVVAPDSSRNEARRLQRAAAAGELRRLHAGIYTDVLEGDPAAIVRRELYPLCALLAPGAVISHRSALEPGPTSAGELFLTGPYRRAIKLPGLTLHIAQGTGPLASDVRIPTARGDVHRSSDARALLENLQPSRARTPNRRRTLGAAQVERWLERLLARDGDASLNRLRDQARAVAKKLRLQDEFRVLDAQIGTLLGTREHRLTHPQAIARARGRPYDAERVELFERLATYLQEQPPVVPRATEGIDSALQAFVESYFSNFIEGTEFELEEAHEIVVRGHPLQYREDDSHDILGTNQAILDSVGAPHFPSSFDSFLQQLKSWNERVIHSRAEKRPGEIKTAPNRAGTTVFVNPELVVGTLERAFEFLAAARTSEARAALAMFIVAEVHPFTDGNGRTARLAMNLALSAESRTRIIVPTVFRDDYLTSLRALSREREPEPYVRMLNRAAAFSGWLDFRSQEACFAQLAASSAMEDPSEAKLTFAPAPTRPSGLLR